MMKALTTTAITEKPRRTEEMMFRNFGDKSLNELRDKLVERGYIEGDMSDEVLEESEIGLEIAG